MSSSHGTTCCALAFALAAAGPVPGAETLARQPGQSAEAFAGAVREWRSIDQKQRDQIARMIEAYPAEITGLENNSGSVSMKLRGGGATAVFDDRKKKTPEQRVESADVEDMLADAYPGDLPERWPVDLDPGRYRCVPFFKAIYGGNPKEVKQNLATVQFCGHKVTFNRANGAAEALKAVGAELKDLVARDPGLKEYVADLGGSYNWRQVADSGTLSAHSFGIAIDLNPKLGGYWNWDKKVDKSDMAQRKKYPAAIVAAFERHGFVWGGKWYHFDLMHFEFRPELVAAGPRVPQNDTTPVAAAVPVEKSAAAHGKPDDLQPVRSKEPEVKESPKDKPISMQLFDAAFDVSPYRGYSQPSKVGILRLVQARLAYEGFYGGPINGTYDDTTAQAIKAWQKEKAMAPNGLLDAMTMGSLNLNDLPQTRSKLHLVSPPPDKLEKPDK